MARRSESVNELYKEDVIKLEVIEVEMDKVTLPEPVRPTGTHQQCGSVHATVDVPTPTRSPAFMANEIL